MQALSKLLPRWANEGTDPLPPEARAAVQQVFEHLGFVATEDVLSLYGAIGGMQMMDDEYWRLWPLEEVAEQSPSSAGVLFSDYCISCWEYRVKPVSAEHSAVYVDHFDGTPPKLVAASLSEFFERYVSNARALLDETSLRSNGDA